MGILLKDPYSDCLDTNASTTTTSTTTPQLSCVNGLNNNNNNNNNLSASTTTATPYGSPYKIQRQQANIRERKRMLRSAPNGYHIFIILFKF